MLKQPLPLSVIDEDSFLGSVERSVNNVFDPVAEWAGIIIFFPTPIPGFDMPFVVLWLLVAAMVITVYLGFIQFRGLKVSFEVIRGKFSSPDDPGEIPHYQALTSALSGTVGLGNIAGVGAAVVLGGPGATFWMILAGLLGMATKFAECTLGVKYREVYADGSVSGGPFKYLPVAFKSFPKFLSVGLTGLFALAILVFGVGGGNMLQANQTFTQWRNVTGGEDGPLFSAGVGLIFGLGIAIIVGLVILGGIKSIGKVTGTLVPFMGIVYVVACLIVILGNIGQVPDAIGAIISGAFTAEGVAGGVLGAVIVGLQRSAFSNEAGLGSAPIAHSAVKTRRPVSEGFVALFEPFIDTVVVCTMTALTIVIADTSGFNDAREAAFEGESSFDGVVITSDAFEATIPWFPVVLAVAVSLFAISTLITWAYYGNKAWNYLFGESRTATNIYKTMFLFFTVTGCVLPFGQVLTFADNFLFVCAFVNLLGVYFLLPVVKREMKEYLADRNSGRLYQLGVEDKDKEIHPDHLT